MWIFFYICNIVITNGPAVARYATYHQLLSKTICNCFTGSMLVCLPCYIYIYCLHSTTLFMLTNKYVDMYVWQHWKSRISLRSHSLGGLNYMVPEWSKTIDRYRYLWWCVDCCLSMQCQGNYILLRYNLQFHVYYKWTANISVAI